MRVGSTCYQPECVTEFTLLGMAIVVVPLLKASAESGKEVIVVCRVDTGSSRK